MRAVVVPDRHRRSRRGGASLTAATVESEGRAPAERAVLWLEVLLAVGAFGGAAGLISGGVDLGAATTRLPFGSTTFAGVALAVVNGILPTGVWLAALRRSRWARQGHHLVGAALVAWIVVQVVFLGWPPHWLQITYFLYGWLVLLLATRIPDEGAPAA